MKCPLLIAPEKEYYTISMFEKLLISHLRWINENSKPAKAGRFSLNSKILIVIYSSAIILYFINFIVLDGSFQWKVANYFENIFSESEYDFINSALPFISPLFKHISWSLGCFTFYFLFPALICKFFFRQPLKDFGFSVKGFVKHFWIYLILFLPALFCVFLVSYTEAFQNTYPFYHEPKGWADLLIWEFFYCLQFFSLEFFFRGFMIHGIKEKFGAWAIIIMVVPYMMIHFQKPMAEAFGAIIAGSILGILSLRLLTIWGGIFIHCAVAVSMDIMSLIQRRWQP